MHSNPVVSAGEILVVDDEPVICELVIRMISGAGYRGRSARETKDALAFFRRDPDLVGAVLLDQSMEGSETFYRALYTARPKLPIIVTSGYASLVSAERFPGLDPEAFIQKPFMKAALIEILKRRLGPSDDTGLAVTHS